MKLYALPPLIPSSSSTNSNSTSSGTTSTTTASSSTNILYWMFAAIVYAVIGQFMSTKVLTAFSILLILGALKINNSAGENVFKDIGL